MSEFAADEPVGPTGQPVQPTELAVQPSEQPMKSSKLAQVSKLLMQPSELRRLLTTFGYLVARQGTTAVLGLAYWAVATHLFSARNVGLAAAASSTALFLAAIGALGIPLLLLAELESVPAPARRVTFSTGMYISCLAVLILSLGTLALSPFLGASLRTIGADPTTAALFVIGSVATMAALTFEQRGNRIAPGLGPAVARQPGLRAEAGCRGCPRPRRDQNSPWPAVRLGIGGGSLARRLYPHAPARTGPSWRGEHQPSGGPRAPLRRALPQAPRSQSVD